MGVYFISYGEVIICLVFTHVAKSNETYKEVAWRQVSRLFGNGVQIWLVFQGT